MTYKNKTRILLLTISSAMLTICGCNSHPSNQPADPEAMDTSVNNRMMVRMAISENIYNGIAAERTVYPKDFVASGASLNELGMRRVETLSEVWRDGASGEILVLRGDANDRLYDARISAVKQQLVDEGIDPARVSVVKADHVNTPGDSSDKAVLIYNRMMSDYSAKKQNGGGNAMQDSFQPSSAAPSNDANK
jgi:hypothetical protein